MRVLLLLLAFAFILVHTFDLKTLLQTNGKGGKLESLLKFMRAFSPKGEFDNDNGAKFPQHPSMQGHEQQEQENLADQDWLMDHLASRRDLVKILKSVYKVIAFKKIVKFFLLFGFMFLFPVMNKSNVSDEVVDLESERDFDIFSFISKNLI
jgi:hypothetical protein